jgi:hypothetical protein
VSSCCRSSGVWRASQRPWSSLAAAKGHLVSTWAPLGLWWQVCMPYARTCQRAHGQTCVARTDHSWASLFRACQRTLAKFHLPCTSSCCIVATFKGRHLPRWSNGDSRLTKAYFFVCSLLLRLRSVDVDGFVGHSTLLATLKGRQLPRTTNVDSRLPKD